MPRPRRSYPSDPPGGGLVCRNVVVAGRRTSLRMEEYLWNCLRDIAAREGMSITALCTEVDRRRGTANLTGSMRLFLVAYYRAAVLHTPALHTQVPHAPHGTAAAGTPEAEPRPPAALAALPPRVTDALAAARL